MNFLYFLSGPLQGLKVRGARSTLVGIVCPPRLNVPLCSFISVYYFKVQMLQSIFLHARSLLSGSYYTYWSYYTYCLNFFLIESIISTGRSQKKSIVLFFLLLYYSSYYTYWLENFPPFTNIRTG